MKWWYNSNSLIFFADNRNFFHLSENNENCFQPQETEIFMRSPSLIYSVISNNVNSYLNDKINYCYENLNSFDNTIIKILQKKIFTSSSILHPNELKLLIDIRVFCTDTYVAIQFNWSMCI